MDDTACLNCARPLGDPRPRFCPHCGQETNLKPPTLIEFAQQFGGAYFSTEGALWRTLALLAFKPGELTRQYLAGRRKHYVLPLRLYLTISLVVLVAMRLMAQNATTATIEVPAGAKAPVAMDLQFGAARVGLEAGVFRCENLPGWVCARVKRRLATEPQAIRDEVARFGERYVGNLGGALFVLVPAFAGWMMLAYRNRRLRYTEHLVFALHLHAFWFLLLGITLAPWVALEVIGLLVAPAYGLAAMRRVYGGRWWPLLARAAAVSAAYLATLLVVLAGLALWSALF
jgi:hypothetical protein